MSKEYKLNIGIEAKAGLPEAISLLEKMVEKKNELKGSLTLIKDEDIKGLTELLSNVDKITKAIANQKKEVSDKVKAEKESKTVQAQLIKSSDEEIKGKLRLQKVNADQRKALKAQIDLQGTEENSRARARATIKLLTAERDKLNLSTDEGQKRLAELNGQIDKNNQFLTENNDKLGKQRDNIGNYKEDIKGAAAETGLFNTQLGFMGRVGAIATGSLKLIRAGFSSLRAAIISTGLGALIVGLISLGAYFTRTQRGIDAVERASAALGAIFAKLTDAAIYLGEFLVKAFESPQAAIEALDKITGGFGTRLQKAFEDPVQAIKDLGQVLLDNVLNRFKALPLIAESALRLFKGIFNRDLEEIKAGGKDLANAYLQLGTGVEGVADKIIELGKAAKDAFDTMAAEIERVARIAANLKGRLQEIEKAQARYAVKVAESNVALKAAQLIAKDEEESILDRVDAINKVIKAQEAETEQLISFAKQKLAIQKQLNSLSESTEADLQKERDLQIEIFNLEAGLFETKKTFQRDLLRLERQSLKEIEDKKAELAALDEKRNNERLKAIDVRNKLEILQLENQIIQLGETEIAARKELEQKIINLKIEQLEKERDEALKNTELTEDERFLIIAETENKILQLKKKNADEAVKIDGIVTKEQIANADKVISAINTAQAKAAQSKMKTLDDEVAAQRKSLTRQEDRAAKGMENTVEFEQKKLADLEQERIKAQKKEENRLKRTAFLNLLSSYAKTDPNTALQKALKDTLISEGLMAAFAEEGGIAGEVKDSTMIGGGRLSRSHGRGRDRLMVLDKREGILTTNQMANLGKDGFYNLQNMLNNPLSDDVLFPKVPMFMPIAASNGNKELSAKLDNLINVVKNRPSSHSNIDQAGNIMTMRIEDGVKYIKKTISKKPKFKR